MMTEPRTRQVEIKDSGTSYPCVTITFVCESPMAFVMFDPIECVSVHYAPSPLAKTDTADELIDVLQRQNPYLRVGDWVNSRGATLLALCKCMENEPWTDTIDVSETRKALYG